MFQTEKMEMGAYAITLYKVQKNVPDTRKKETKLVSVKTKSLCKLGTAVTRRNE